MDTRELRSRIIPSGSQARSEGESLRQQARSVHTSRMKHADCSGAASNGSPNDLQLPNPSSTMEATTMDRACAAEQDKVLPVRVVREKPFITMSHYKDFLNAQSQGLPWKPTSISESLAVPRVGQSVTVKEKAKITADVQDISEESSNCENSSQDNKDASSKEDLPEQYMSDVDLPQDDNRNQAKGKGVASKKRHLSQNNVETDKENPGRQIVAMTMWGS